MALELFRRIFPSRASQAPTPEITSFYEAVPNHDLRQFLVGFEHQVMQGINEDFFPARRLQSHLQLTTLTGMSRWNIASLYDLVRRRGIIEFTSVTHGSRSQDTSYLLGKDEVRVFAAICWWSRYKSIPDITRDPQSLVSDVREAFGPHPLAQLLKDPKDPKSPQQRKASTDIKERESAEIDFSSGKFWETPLGRSVREFARGIPLEDRTSSIKTLRVSQLLDLKYSRVSPTFITVLAGSGILAGVERQPSSGYYRLRPEHVLISGLVLLYLEKGYSPETIVERLAELLEGTSLRQFVGFEMKFLQPLRGRDFFNPSSPWRDFPLVEARGEEASKAIVSKKPSRQDRGLSPSRSLSPAEDSGDDERGDYGMTIEGAEARADGELRVRQKPLFERVPQITDQQLKEISKWDKGEIFNLLMRVKGRDMLNDVSYNYIGVSLEVVQAVMFIDAFVTQAWKQLESYDPQLAHLTYPGLRRGLEICLRYFDENPQCKNLAILFESILREVEKKG